MVLNYRRAAGTEANLLIDLYNKSFYQDFLKYGECPAYGQTTKQMQQSIEKFPKEIILCNGISVGVISVKDNGNGDYYLGCLCVIPEYQNKGIGGQAVRHWLDNHKDWKKVSLITPTDKDGNIYFYTQKCNFKVTGTEFDGSIKVVRLMMERP